MNKIHLIEKRFLKKHVTSFSVGDTLKVYVKVVEGEKTRLQAFEGVVIADKGTGIQQSFTLRRISYGEGVERIFPLHSPFLEKIEVVKHGKTRRAKLYYLRKRIGKKTKLKEKGRGAEERRIEASSTLTGEAKVEAESPST